jgi:ABC-2 type transport system permease protein
MGHIFKVLLSYFSAFWKITLTYRAMLLINGLRLILLPIILLFAWLSIEKAPGNPYTNQDYILYFLLVPIVLNLTDSRTIFKFTVSIRDGSLNRALLKPHNPLLIHLSETITEKSAQLIYLIPFTFFMGIIFKDRLPVLDYSAPHLLLFALAISLGFLIRFLVAGTISILGFWIENVTTLNLVVNGGIWALLGGMLVPVETFPPKIKMIAHLLPYRYMLSFPIEVFRGKLPQNEILFGIGVILTWSLALSFIMKTLWKKGLKVYSAYGG